MRSYPSVNSDMSGEASTVLLTADALHAACRRLVSACLRRWALISSIEASSIGFIARRDLVDDKLVEYFRLARDLQNTAVIRGMLADDPALRALFSHPVVELTHAEAVAPARQVVRSRRHEREQEQQ
jgi:hypothetical protein